MSTNISKQKREDLLNKIKEIRTFISAAPQDENTGNLLSYLFDRPGFERNTCHINLSKHHELFYRLQTQYQLY